MINTAGVTTRPTTARIKLQLKSKLAGNCKAVDFAAIVTGS